MEYMTTFTGNDFAPFSPDIDKIKIEDIAHALSLTCRANGHFEQFYSVARHCLNCAAEANARGLSVRLQIACLLHDGSEAYISDIVRPVKKHLDKYLQAEKTLQDMIYKKFLGSLLSDEELSIIKRIDNDMLILEFNALMKKKVFFKYPDVKSKPFFEFNGFTTTENEFLEEFMRLMLLENNIINKK
ncbi:MAG: phosphohydrolase [Oscillospiraceae bacterium]|nr:phosphohydrolase [Oscillospiraceae bacterium]